MSTTTTNYNLVKQAGNERPDVSVLNANLDMIDAAMAGKSRAWYATCSDSASTVAKTASCTGFVLEEGALVCVRFANTNTAADATLNINSTGAKAIYANNSTTATDVTWAAGETVPLVYDGTYYRMVGSKGVNNVRSQVYDKLVKGQFSMTGYRVSGNDAFKAACVSEYMSIICFLNLTGNLKTTIGAEHGVAFVWQCTSIGANYRALVMPATSSDGLKYVSFSLSSV